MNLYSQKNDYLERKNFLKFVDNIIRRYAAAKLSVSFSISGEWGCGKSFVLDKIKHKLDSESCYMVFDYNCWQYDYYEEPLVAIVSIMINEIEKNNFMNKDQRDKILAILKSVGAVFLAGFNNRIKDDVGINIKEIVEELDSIKSITEEKLESINDIDKFRFFNQTLESMRESLKEIAEKRTIIFIVDELDRCRPEYALKVLERLHHISYGINNFITIIAVDEGSMLKSIEQIFGYSDKNEQVKFLKKFIQFSLRLTSGSPKRCEEKYSTYLSLFKDTDRCDFDDYISILFKEILEKDYVIRDQEIIFDKAHTVHRFTRKSNDPKLDYSVMYMELLLTTFYYYKDNKLKTLRDNIDKIIEDKGLDSYDEKEGLKVIRDNIWHVLKWYISFLPIKKFDGKLDLEEPGLSKEVDHIKDFELKSNLKILKKYIDNLKFFV